MIYIHKLMDIESAADSYCSFKDTIENFEIERKRTILKHDIDTARHDYLSSGKSFWGDKVLHLEIVGGYFKERCWVNKKGE